MLAGGPEVIKLAEAYGNNIGADVALAGLILNVQSSQRAGDNGLAGRT